jgi:hypothetical protein
MLGAVSEKWAARLLGGFLAASLRFLGRKVYLAATIILISILREGATQARMRRSPA